MENSIHNPDPKIISYLTIRKSIGFLGVLLPAALLIGTFAVGKCDQIQHSISHYYYTMMGDLFVGVLCAIALFLISYKGFDKMDHIATNLAGLFALGIAFFPTTGNPDLSCTVRFLDENPTREMVHYVSAALFFLTLAFISFFLFTKSQGTMTREKIARNKIYRICAIIILLSIVFIYFFNTNLWLEDLKPVFWLEWIALIAFGLSWLIKGELLLKDK